MSATTEKIRLGAGDHAVHFYADDAELARVVGGHLAEALGEGEAAIVIATESHARAFKRHLATAGLDPRGLEATGQLTFFDAAETLSKLTVSGQIDRDVFQRLIGGVVRQAGEGGRSVRAYGEMVDLLWQAGDVSDAIELETLWNELIEELHFSLLCAYHSEAVDRPGDEGALGEVCRLHSSVSKAPAVQEPEAHEVSREFMPDPGAPAAARRLIEDALQRWGQTDARFDDARLLMSELVTNAVTHAESPFSVFVRSQDSRVRIAVQDHSLAEPTLRPLALDAQSGRGLQLVAALSSDWGVTFTPAGKTVWAEL